MALSETNLTPFETQVKCYSEIVLSQILRVITNVKPCSVREKYDTLNSLLSVITLPPPNKHLDTKHSHTGSSSSNATTERTDGFENAQQYRIFRLKRYIILELFDSISFCELLLRTIMKNKLVPGSRLLMAAITQIVGQSSAIRKKLGTPQHKEFLTQIIRCSFSKIPQTPKYFEFFKRLQEDAQNLLTILNQ